MNYRNILKQNIFKTRMVIFTYLTIMVFVGLLVDVVFMSSIGREDNLTDALLNFITLQEIPFATIIITLIVLIGIFIVTKFGSKIMLSGSEYENLSKKQNLNGLERTILNMVEEMSISANIGFVPETYLMKTTQINAFAAGWNKDNGIVCVTTGLINTLNRAETQAVIAHEIGHIIHGDSRLTMYIGVLSNIILTIVNIFSRAVGSGKSNSKAQNKAQIILFILNLILPLITTILYFYLSRTREYMADAVAVRLTGDNEAMKSALRKISSEYREDEYLKGSLGEKYRSAAYIFVKGDGFFSTHPSIENRIMKLS